MQPSPRFPRRSDGFALVLVLSALVLLTAFALAFFLSVRHERTSAALDAGATDVRDLANSTLNLAVAQIRDATSGLADPAVPTSGAVAWASQPGLIRTFDGSLVNAGNPSGQLRAYKLYSARSMSGDATFNPATDADDVPPTDWSSRANRALFTDLNAPVTNINHPAAADALVYPIVDPRAAPDYPGAGANPNGVNGFSVHSAPVDPASATANPLPMPVRWLYQLRDGTLEAAVSGGDGIAKFSADFTRRMATNPIVARVAFWTDDDSCKVNVNTAAGDAWNAPNIDLQDNGVTERAPGSYWAVPRLSSIADRLGYAQRLPGTGEYQRFPGHPATTYLSAVFPWLTPAQIASLAPRVQPGGTLGGAQNSAVNPITLDRDRLYASVDEMAFAQPAAGGDRTLQNSILQPAQVEQSRFFLTAHSRAPELNLSGRPRIGIWPQWDDAGKRTTFDKLIAFCSTVGQGTGARPYYFTRQDPTSATVDGALARNQQVYSYLQSVTNTPVPGFANSFSAKYGADRDQILTEILDYIRCTNLADRSAGAAPYTPTNFGNNDGPGVVVPLKIAGNSTRGFGRFPTISEVGLLLYYYNTNLDKTPPSNDLPPNPAVQGVLLLEHYCPSNGSVPLFPDFTETISGLEAITVQDVGGSVNPVAFHNGTNHITARSWTWEQAYGGLMGWQVGFYGRQALSTDSTGGAPSGYPFFTDPLVLPPGTTLLGVTGGTITITLRDNVNSAVVQTMQVTIPQAAFPMPVVAPNNTNGIYYSWTNDGRTWNLSKFNNRLAGYQQHNNGVPPLIARNGPLGATGDSTGDVVKSIEPGGTIRGDHRLLTLTENAPATFFAPHANYARTNVFAANSLRNSGSGAANLYWSDPHDDPTSTTHDPFSDLGKLDAATPLFFIPNQPIAPDIPSSVATGAAGNIGYAGAVVPGDWDNGAGDSLDGAMINKADEGWVGNSPYYGGQGDNPGSAPGATQFSPNRMVSSPVHFGSLSTGLKANVPWRTLLFCPNPAAGGVLDSTTGRYMANHFGRTDPPDHLWLDLFNMPVVEPYAESEPFSTAGKINPNYQIAPFPYVQRSTGMRALLRSVRVTAIPTSAAKNQDGNSSAGDQGAGFPNYKTYWWNSSPRRPNYRDTVDADKTLRSFDARFTKNQPFKTASQICEMYLYPAAPAVSSDLPYPPAWDAQDSGIANWWTSGVCDSLNPNMTGYRLTGDNLREEPYDLLYPRLTTQSNTYTVHLRVQTLQKTRGSASGTWDEVRDNVQAEYRGSYTVERFLDPNDPRFQSSNANYLDPDTANLAPAYKVRVVDSKKFSP